MSLIEAHAGHVGSLPQASRPALDWIRGGFALAATLIGSAVLLGWTFDVTPLKTVLPGMTTMKANTALGLAATGCGLLLLPRMGGITRRRVLLTLMAGATAVLLGATTLAEYASGMPLGLDELLFADPNTTSPPYPGRMSPATAIGLVCLGLAVVLLGCAAQSTAAQGSLGETGRFRRRCAKAAHLLACVPAGIGYLSLAGYAYQVEGLYSFGAYVVVAVHTAVGLVLLATATLFTLPDLGWQRAFAGYPVARHTLMRLVPFSLLLPFLAGMGVVWGARAQVYDPLYGPALFALAAAISCILLALTAVMAVRQAEQALTEGEMRLRLALEAGGLGAFEWELQSDVIRPTHRTRAIFAFRDGAGTRSADYFGRVVAEDIERVHAEMERGLAAGRITCSFRIRLPDGTIRRILIRGDVVRDRNDHPSRLVGVMTDETARWEAEAALRRTNETLEARVSERTSALRGAIDALQTEALERERAEDALRQSQKMEAVGQLTGGLAHDFNNLLTGISGSLELLQARIAQGQFDDMERYLVPAQAAAQRASALTHRMLAFGRRQTLAPKPTDVNRLASGLEELVRRTVGPAILVVCVAADGLWTTLVDQNQLENALLNLCVNARDAMPDGGRLTIATGNASVDEATARERGLPAGDYVSLCVTDTGAGFEPEVAARAFDPFFTTKPIGMGTGLGLSMVYGFARQSGGQACIHSAPGRGATLCLYLPRHLGAVEVEPPPAPLSTDMHAEAGETVLVVDDDPTVRMLVTEVLHDRGYTLIEAVDGSAGLRVLQSNASISLLVTDVGMPGMNGRQLADTARVTRPDLKVLFITGYAENAALSHGGGLAPGMHVLVKPFAMEALASRVRTLLATP